MRSYECAVIFAPSAGEETVDTSARKYAQVIADQGGELTGIETWGKRRLAYEIDHHGEGYYYFYRFRGKGELLTELGRQMRIDEGIIRHMIIRDELAKGDEPALEAGQMDPVLKKEREEG